MYYGDYDNTTTVHIKFTTVSSTGSPATLAAGSITVFKGDSTTQDTSTAALLTTNFDSNISLNHVRILPATDTAFYSPSSDFQVVASGTIGTVSVSGYLVGAFSIMNRSHLRPTTTGRTLDVSATGEAGLDWNNVGGATTSVTLSATTINDLTTKSGFLLSAVGSAQLTEGYATVSVAPTLNQAVYMILQLLQNRSVSGTVLTVKKLDNSTTAMTYTLDSATVPTSQVRAT